MKHLVRFAPLVLALLLGASPAAKATGVVEVDRPSLREAVDALIDGDEASRKIARRAILTDAEPETLAAVLAAIEARFHAAPVLRTYDVRDLVGDDRPIEELAAELGALAKVDAKAHDGTLVVSGPPDAQEKVAAELAKLRAAGGRIVTLTTRIVTGALPIAALAEGEARVLSPEETEQVRAAIAGGAVETVTAPRITVYSGERANVTVLEKHSFVTDYELDHPAPGTFVADPVVTTVTDGLILDLRPRLKGDTCVLTANLTSSRLKKPVASREIDLGVGAPVTIQLPCVVTVSRRVVANVPLDATVVIELPILDDAGESRSGVLLVEAARVLLEEGR